MIISEIPTTFELRVMGLTRVVKPITAVLRISAHACSGLMTSPSERIVIACNLITALYLSYALPTAQRTLQLHKLSHHIAQGRCNRRDEIQRFSAQAIVHCV